MEMDRLPDNLNVDAVIISGMPADNPANRARAVEFGWSESKEWPVPYADSAPSACLNCGSEILLGPKTFETYLSLMAQGKSPIVMCLICCALLKQGGADVNVIALTDKKSGE